MVEKKLSNFTALFGSFLSEKTRFLILKYEKSIYFPKFCSVFFECEKLLFFVHFFYWIFVLFFQIGPYLVIKCWNWIVVILGGEETKRISKFEFVSLSSTTSQLPSLPTFSKFQIVFFASWTKICCVCMNGEWWWNR